MSKTTALTPAEWRALCLLNTSQLMDYLQHIAIPDEEIAAHVATHLDRFGSFFQAWRVSAPAAAVSSEAPKTEATNGAHPPKRGRGRPRKAPAQPEAVQ